MCTSYLFDQGWALKVTPRISWQDEPYTLEPAGKHCKEKELAAHCSIAARESHGQRDA